MKKLFFWTNYYIEQNDVGTTVKIKNEIQALRQIGYIVTYTAYISDGVAIFDNSDSIVVFEKFKFLNSKLVSLTRKDSLISICRKYLKNKTFDYFLLRINYFSSSYMKMLKEMKAQGALVMMESLSYFPGISHSFFKAPKLYAVAHSLERNRKELNKCIDLMLTEGHIDDYYGIPCIEFGMGVKVEDFRPHYYCGDKDTLNMLMVGCTSIYHGTDRILASLKKYLDDSCANSRVYLHLVGDVLDKDKEYIITNNLEDHVILYGRQFGNKLEDIYDKCNVALGPLSQHRMQKKDTGLKTKEYFAKGIPYVYSGDEPCIEDDYPYIFEIPNDESLISIADVWNFYNGICKTDIVSEMRKTAVEVFEWKNLFKKAFSKLHLESRS